MSAISYSEVVKQKNKLRAKQKELEKRVAELEETVESQAAQMASGGDVKGAAEFTIRRAFGEIDRCCRHKAGAKHCQYGGAETGWSCGNVLWVIEELVKCFPDIPLPGPEKTKKPRRAMERSEDGQFMSIGQGNPADIRQPVAAAEVVQTAQYEGGRRVNEYEL